MGTGCRGLTVLNRMRASAELAHIEPALNVSIILVKSAS